MKVILVLIAVYALWWLLRRSLGSPRRPAASPPPRVPQAMVVCAWCGIHLPHDETLPGRGGVFCGEAHRAAFESANPPS